MTQSTDPIRLEPPDFFFVMFRVEEEADHAHSHVFRQCARSTRAASRCTGFTNVPVSDSSSLHQEPS
jgi:hypothetical protein